MDLQKKLNNIKKQCSQGELVEALTHLMELEYSQKNNAEIYFLIGWIHHHQGRLEQAQLYFEKAYKLYGESLGCETLNNYSIALIRQSKYNLAHQVLVQILQKKSNDKKAQINTILVLAKMQKNIEALKFIEHFFDLNLIEIDTLVDCAHELIKERFLDLASHCLTCIFRVTQVHAEANLLAGYLELCRGNFEQGWLLHEWRWKNEPFNKYKMPHEKPLWSGHESLLGKKIWILYEQGVGDTFQFCRYLLILVRMGASVFFTVEEPMISILQKSFLKYDITVSSHRLLPVSYDYYSPLLSLPLACGTTNIDKIPCDIPYIEADDLQVAKWREKILHVQTKIRVGLVWAGNQNFNADKDRSLLLTQLASLFENNHSIQFFSLQKGESAKQLQERNSCGWSNLAVADYTSDLHDWEDTAALIANLDLVISVDTAVAHLAGAMGKPVWLLSRFNGCWRWLEDRTDSPWYPTMRIFRQPKAGDWDSVIEQVKLALQGLAALK
jgi:Tfp pilus assembly protein PilF